MVYTFILHCLLLPSHVLVKPLGPDPSLIEANGKMPFGFSGGSNESSMSVSVSVFWSCYVHFSVKVLKTALNFLITLRFVALFACFF